MQFDVHRSFFTNEAIIASVGGNVRAWQEDEENEPQEESEDSDDRHDEGLSIDDIKPSLQGMEKKT